MGNPPKGYLEELAPPEPVRTEVSPEDREEVLRYASVITTQAGTATAVVASSSPLLEWLERAPDLHDQERRMKALSRHWGNIINLDLDAREPLMDDPEGFVREAKLYYGFAVGNA